MRNFSIYESTKTVEVIRNIQFLDTSIFHHDTHDAYTSVNKVCKDWDINIILESTLQINHISRGGKSTGSKIY